MFCRVNLWSFVFWRILLQTVLIVCLQRILLQHLSAWWKNTMQSLWFSLWHQTFQWPFVSWQGTTFSFTDPAKFHSVLHQITYMRSNTDPGNLGVINPSLFTLLYPSTSLEGHKNIIAVVLCLRTSVKLKSHKNITLNCKRVTQLPWQREQQSELLQVVFLEAGNRSRLSLYLVLTLS